MDVSTVVAVRGFVVADFSSLLWPFSQPFLCDHAPPLPPAFFFLSHFLALVCGVRRVAGAFGDECGFAVFFARINRNRIINEKIAYLPFRPALTHFARQNLSNIYLSTCTILSQMKKPALPNASRFNPTATPIQLDATPVSCMQLVYGPFPLPFFFSLSAIMMGDHLSIITIIAQSHDHTQSSPPFSLKSLKLNLP